MTEKATPITIAYGDGIGPEIMEACLDIIKEASANITVESIEVGERIYKQGAKDGILPSAWPLLERVSILLLGPVVMPNHTKCMPLHESMANELGLMVSRKFDAQDVIPAQAGILLDTSNERQKTPAFAGVTKLKDFGYTSIGERFALFSSSCDADIKKAGKDIANPSALLHSVIAMLAHIDQKDVAANVYEAWRKTLEDGLHTKDMLSKDTKEIVGTKEFTEAVIARLKP